MLAAFWEGTITRFAEAGQQRLEREGHAPAAARATAFTLVWMTERSCFEQAVRGAGLPEEDLVTAITEVWWRALRP